MSDVNSSIQVSMNSYRYEGLSAIHITESKLIGHWMYKVSNINSKVFTCEVYLQLAVEMKSYRMTFEIQ
jgi:hypothetical protein